MLSHISVSIVCAFLLVAHEAAISILVQAFNNVKNPLYISPLAIQYTFIYYRLLLYLQLL
jgi:hypothetical protein